MTLKNEFSLEGLDLSSESLRLNYICDRFRLSPKDLSERMQNEISVTHIESILNGTEKPSERFYQAMEKYIPVVEKVWFRTGEGSIFNPIPEDAPVFSEQSLEEQVHFLKIFPNFSELPFNKKVKFLQDCQNDPDKFSHNELAQILQEFS